VTAFFKLSGSGNDFLALADPAGDLPVPGREQIRAWCRRGVSLGADGLFFLRRRPGSAETEVVMDYWNADGLPADLCLNGTRCAAQLACHLGWATERVRIETAAGPVVARRIDAARIAVRLPAPAAPPRAVTLAALGRSFTGWAITVGVPHLVLPWPESLAEAPVVPLGRALRFDPAFAPAGTNVNFVRFPRPERMEIRTYERGVEDETLSCGSGMLAGAAVGLHLFDLGGDLGGATLPLTVLTQGGFELEVAGDPAEAGAWSLTGDARVVAQGDLLAAAEVEPPAPAWSPA
jgi:diaminopimelate epimerase